MRPVTLNLTGIKDPQVLAALMEIQRASQDTLQSDSSSPGAAMGTVPFPKDGSFTSNTFAYFSQVSPTIRMAFAPLTTSVLMYGADNTGATPSNSAFAAAIAAASASSGVLYIPAGTYELGSGLIALPSNISIFGDGDLTVLRMSVNAQSPVFYLDNVVNIEIKSLKFLYTPGSVSLGYAQAGILLRNGCQNIKIKNISLYFFNRGINVLNSRAVLIENIYALGCFDAGIRLVSDHAAGIVFNAENPLLSADESSASQVEDFVINSVMVDGALTQGSITPSGFYGINLASVLGSNGDLMRNIAVSNCCIFNTHDQGTVVAGVSEEISFTNVVCRSTTTTGVGFLTEVIGASDQPILTTYTGCAAHGYEYGFWNINAPYTSYINCTAQQQVLTGFFVQELVDFLNFSGCYAVSCGASGFNTVGLSYSTIIGCFAILNGADGFQMDGTGVSTILAFNHALSNTSANYSIGAGVTQTGNL